MGGLIGMALASLDGSPVGRMVLNEAGPVVTGVSLNRIGGYVGKAPAFPTFEAADQYVRAVSVFFGPHTDAEWRPHRALRAAPARRQLPRPLRSAHRRAVQRQRPAQGLELWTVWEAVKCPTLVIRGGPSDLLMRETVERMEPPAPTRKPWSCVASATRRR